MKCGQTAIVFFAATEWRYRQLGPWAGRGRASQHNCRKVQRRTRAAYLGARLVEKVPTVGMVWGNRRHRRTFFWVFFELRAKILK